MQDKGAMITIRARLSHLRWPFSVVGAKEGEEILSEATGGDRAQMKRSLIEKSLQDDAFRQRLLEDPKALIEQELGTPVPDEVQILAVEETPETIYLVLPPATSAVGRDGEIPDRDLEAVSGGKASTSPYQTCPSWVCV